MEILTRSFARAITHSSPPPPVVCRLSSPPPFVPMGANATYLVPSLSTLYMVVFSSGYSDHLSVLYVQSAGTRAARSCRSRTTSPPVPLVGRDGGIRNRTMRRKKKCPRSRIVPSPTSSPRPNPFFFQGSMNSLNQIGQKPDRPHMNAPSRARSAAQLHETPHIAQLYSNDAASERPQRRQMASLSPSLRSA